MYWHVAAGIALGSCLLVACAGPVAVPPASPSGSPATLDCANLIEALPSSVLDAVRRKTEPTTSTTAAWGDPPITLRCGVPRPAELQPTSTLLSVDEVDWLPVQRSAGYVFTSVGRTAYVEVSVPSSYAPETEVLPDLAGAINRAIPPVSSGSADLLAK